MTDTEIIETLRNKLAKDVGRHLYGVLGSYMQLEKFSSVLTQARTHDGMKFPQPISLNQGIMESIPDAEFKLLVENEAKRPEPTAAHVARAFENYIWAALQAKNLLIIKEIELLFAYNCELNILRTLSTDTKKIILLLPGKRVGERIIMFHGLNVGNYELPANLIANDHIWQL